MYENMELTPAKFVDDYFIIECEIKEAIDGK